MPNLASQMPRRILQHGRNTGSSSPGELRDDAQHLRSRSLLLQRLGEVPCFGQLGVRLQVAFPAQRMRYARGQRQLLAFVPVERRLRPPVWLFAPLRDKVTSSAQSLVPSTRAHAKDRACQS